MRIVSFTMVNNEAEIIESFIRYNSNFVDEMVIIDNGCTDNTIPIIRNLINEGYAISIYDESLEGYDQFRLDNKYLNLICNKKNADLIIPLDADEFIISENNPRKSLEQLSLDKIYYIHWEWYVMTKEDDQEENFIPKKMQYCLEKTPWNYSDGKPVTKVIIPAKYYKEKNLTMTMGHHSVYGKGNFRIEEINNIRLAHFRSISTQQLVSKTVCYTVRDISALENNYETAQRTNQMAIIDSGIDLNETTILVSYGGYESSIVYKPINLRHCDNKTMNMKYQLLSNTSIELVSRKTGCEMAIKYYNLERKIRERKFLPPIIVWMDGIRGEKCIFPDPSNELTFITAMVNVRAYLTVEENIKFLKANYRLIITPEWVKFIPHAAIIVVDDKSVDDIKNKLSLYGLDREVKTWKQYKKDLNYFQRLWCAIGFITGMYRRVQRYWKRNGRTTTIKKIKERVNRS